jgi:hypothetical protein
MEPPEYRAADSTLPDEMVDPVAMAAPIEIAANIGAVCRIKRMRLSVYERRSTCQ